MSGMTACQPTRKALDLWLLDAAPRSLKQA